ncbi:hypothetical protein PHMEG_0007169 [Phytophthora megakarya]|uniref:Uncharacterized protein n=1 Tax=Phytophthora megakarya TaxID=4795 RepID=A0A225WM02_9STRA|nr:hypothetical protein PHMEG_0007169 [Phytophthora megakarya]
MMKRLMTDALRIAFDGLNTLSFVFPSKRTAKPWEGAALKFRSGALVLASANATQIGIKPPPQIAQYYAINVIGVAQQDPLTLMAVFNAITGNGVFDIRQRGLDGLNEADNDYWTFFVE